MYSTLLPVFWAHSSAAALVQRPPSPTSESPANRTVAPKTAGVIKEATTTEPNHRRAFRLRNCIWESIGGDLSRWEVNLLSINRAKICMSSEPEGFFLKTRDLIFRIQNSGV